ncbi:phosphoglycerate dehydrogenase [Oceanithermus desulfurans]|uniref:D-3-phosphoglycerate dehydrogenase n=2 Tax=Oceanithermus desulfurans TaxID=227924 RepID=A0A511RKL9_9DEIN|nr:phosphoglycerate dehydrogenase [Oceanithermus desulfurans]MBB6030333.1 D-3-phosphoglycerate dehydrogenase [Oceanithermus desulfurans]GEM89366.1 D-3-phosphoglycerate dehydrogenase [Oceanithermus desulfurans NBRC 100063]
MWRVLVTDEMHLGDHDHPDLQLDYRPGMPREEILASIADYDALITRSRTQVDRELLERAARLKVIGRGGVGVDNIDLDAASRRGILVINVPEANTRSAAELAFGLMLAAARLVALSDRELRDGRWNRKHLGRELMNKRLGIVGLGRIGGQVAQFARAFGMEVWAYDPYISSKRAETLGVRLVDRLEALLPEVQFLTVHTPLNEETRDLIGRRELYLLPRGAVVVNAARGGIVNEPALYDLLEEGHLFAVGLDVFAVEPPDPEHPLLHHPRVVHTAHLGANTEEAQARVGHGIVERVYEALSGNYAYAINAGFDPEAFQALKGWMPLAEALGRLLAQITRGRAQTLEVAVLGGFECEPEPVFAAVAKGVLEPVIDEPVNYVSSRPRLEERGVRLISRRDPDARGYAQAIEVRLVTDQEERRALGTVLAGRPRLVRIDDYALEIEPTGAVLVCINRDQPGVVGRVGTLLGEAGVNIAGLQLGRDQPGGRALFVLAVDQPPPDEVLEELRNLELLERVDAAWL